MAYPENMKDILSSTGKLIGLIAQILDMSLVSKEWSEEQYEKLAGWMRDFGYTDGGILQLVEHATKKNFFGDHNWKQNASKLQIEKLARIERMEESKKEYKEKNQPNIRRKINLA